MMLNAATTAAQANHFSKAHSSKHLHLQDFNTGAGFRLALREKLVITS